MTQIRFVSSSAVDFPAMLRMVLRIPGGDAIQSVSEVEELLAAERRGELQLGPAFVPDVGGIPQVAVIGLQSGCAASLLLLSPLGVANDGPAAGLCLEAAKRHALDRGCKLLEVLLDLEDSQDRRWHRSLRDAGFRFLTRLVYLTLQVSDWEPAPASTWEENLVDFAPNTRPLFLRCMEESYHETLDCPELAGLRTTEEVLAGHRAAGEFNPRLWKLVLRDGKPVGVLLLNALRGGGTTEITYLGVAQTARRTGVARELVRAALALSRLVGAKQMALAVDERNVPARRLYAACGFQLVQHRDVWIAACAQVAMGSDVGNL